MLPRPFGPYVLLKALGEGAIGRVYQARHELLDRIVALKVLKRKWLPHSAIVDRFRLEIRAGARLSHPNVVQVHHAGEAEGTYFIDMEFVSGVDLEELVRRTGPLSVDRAVDFIRQAALGIQHIHDNGFVLRDVKPSNLLVSLDATVKVIDLSILCHSSRSRSMTPCETLTDPGIFVGTADYASPEQVQDAHDVDARSDLYSLGATFYHILTGQVPFPGGSLLEKLEHHCGSDEPLSVRQLRPEIPKEVATVVRHLMAKRPEDRYQSAAEVASVLTRYQQGSLRRGRGLATVK